MPSVTMSVAFSYAASGSTLTPVARVEPFDVGVEIGGLMQERCVAELDLIYLSVLSSTKALPGGSDSNLPRYG
jgi:hypothetical protein